jgi:prolyl oligopeptidase
MADVHYACCFVLAEIALPHRSSLPLPLPSRRAVLRAVALAAATVAAPGLSQARAAARRGPPVARIEPVTETFFGQAVTDPYRWMENPKDRDWEPFMKGQDAHARQVLGAIPGRDVLKARIGALSGGNAVAYGVRSAGGQLFYQVRPAGADNFKLAVRTGVAGAERILIDPTTMKGDGGVHLSLDWWAPSPDGKWVVYGLSAAGSENSVAHVMEVATARVLPERIGGTQYAQPAWLPDSSGFFYWRVADLGKAGTVDYYQNGPSLLHRLNTDPKDDPVVMRRGKDPAVEVAANEFPYVLTPQTGDFVLLLVQGGVRRENPLYVARLADLVAGQAQWKPVCTLDDQVVDFAFDGADLYLLTTRGAENGKVLRTPLAQASYREATVVVPEGPLVIEGIVLARDGLYVRDLDGGYHTVRKLARGGTLAPVPLAWEGSISGMSASPSEDGLWLDGTAWLLPFSVFRHDPVAGRTERVPLTPLSTLDLASYEAVRLTVTARDGTQVPLSVVAKKGLPRNGRNPALVQAYGSYQISTNPYFSPRNLAFLERGGVLAVAHVRGGGEYGRRWWKGGQKLSKPNTWRDLIDCCEHLIRERWTGKGALTIQGGSAGGITVGMALTERPDLFAGVISNVGVSNALRAEFGQNGPPNIDEFGTVTDADGFKGLRAMDALHHVRDGTRYPAVLLTIGMTDPRVEAWQGAKMVARLQKANRSKHPILLRVSFDAGHGLGSTRAQIDDERADEFAFALWRAGRRSVA